MSQGGTPNGIGYLGSNLFFRQVLGNLPTYVIRHIDIYGNMTSSPPVLSTKDQFLGARGCVELTEGNCGPFSAR